MYQINISGRKGFEQNEDHKNYTENICRDMRPDRISRLIFRYNNIISGLSIQEEKEKTNMTDMFNNPVLPGDKIIFGDLIKSGYDTLIRSPLRTGVVDSITKSGEYCIVLAGGKTPTGKPKTFKLEKRNIVKYDYPFEVKN